MTYYIEKVMMERYQWMLLQNKIYKNKAKLHNEGAKMNENITQYVTRTTKSSKIDISSCQLA